eukprot:TRINITY_DN21220_c0_g1_i2.p1 TRINITY_DN21220_c0_g1~~TRINITY_DN21220_c0_g1_i2.p1  ORF type:complete len:232 (+),score=24.34 TRINITY_DN21220_c0_g1_i2:195-890(+)
MLQCVIIRLYTHFKRLFKIFVVVCKKFNPKMFVRTRLFLACFLLSNSIEQSTAQNVPLCECVNAAVDCGDNTAINAVIGQLLDNSATCLNGCAGECQQAFYYLHAYHEVCTNSGLDAHEVYHDFALGCAICDLGSLVPTIPVTAENMCPEVDCSNLDDQNELTNLLISVDCQSDCFSNQICEQGWKKLSAYHETCAEDSLAALLTTEYHDIEIVCPPECVLPTTNTTVTCV